MVRVGGILLEAGGPQGSRHSSSLRGTWRCPCVTPFCGLGLHGGTLEDQVSPCGAHGRVHVSPLFLGPSGPSAPVSFCKSLRGQCTGRPCDTPFCAGPRGPNMFVILQLAGCTLHLGGPALTRCKFCILPSGPRTLAGPCVPGPRDLLLEMIHVVDLGSSRN